MTDLGFNAIGGLKVFMEPGLPTRHRVRFPRKGPYFQRRLKRSAGDPRNWEEAKFLTDGNSIHVHPAEWPRLKKMLIDAGVHYV